MFVEASAPGRVNLFGNPLDIYGGCVISSAIAPRAKVGAHGADGLRFTVGDQTCLVRGEDDLLHRGDRFDFLRALVRSLGAPPAVDIRVTTDIPVRSGLAGSAALMLAASACLLDLGGRPATRQDVLKTAHRAEVEYLNNFCGWNDFYASMLGGVHEMNYRGPLDGAPGVTPLALPEHDVSFAVALTGDMHRSGKVNSNLWHRWQSGDPVVRTAYGKLKEESAAARRIFEAKDWPAFGELMWRNFLCQYRLDAANEVEHELASAAMSLGAFGAKLCGAGHCGSIVILARDEDHARIRRGLESLGAREYFTAAPAEGLVVRRG